MMNTRATARFFLHSHSPEKQQVSLDYFRDSGVPGNQGYKLELDKGAIKGFGSNNYPGQIGIDGWARITASDPLDGAALLRKSNKISDMLPLLRPLHQAIATHLAVAEDWQSLLGLINLSSEKQKLVVRAMVEGEPVGTPWEPVLEAHAKKEFILNGALFNISETQLAEVWLQIKADSEVAGYLSYCYKDVSQSSIPLESFDSIQANRSLAPLAVVDGWWTGLVLVNIGNQAQQVHMNLCDEAGRLLERKTLEFFPGERKVASLADLFPGIGVNQMALLQLENAEQIKALVVYGYNADLVNTTHMSAQNW
jgi:hypothetical protein